MAPHIQVPCNLNMFDPMSHGPKYPRVHPLHVKQQTGGWTAHHSFICSHLDCEKPKFVAQSFNCSSIPHITLSLFGRGFFMWLFTLLQVGPCAKRELTLAQYRQHDPDVSLTCLDTTKTVTCALHTVSGMIGVSLLNRSNSNCYQPHGQKSKYVQ